MSKKTEGFRLQLVKGLLRQLNLESISKRFEPRSVLALFSLVNGTMSIMLIAIVAMLSQQAFIFPSLGATAFLLFHVPMAEAASPRNTILAHLTGAVCGWVALLLFGLHEAPSALVAGIDWPRVFATSLSLGAACALMVLFNMAHPPAAATALIVSLGLMPNFGQLPILMAAVGLLVAQAFVINRLAGIPYPLWKRPKPNE